MKRIKILFVLFAILMMGSSMSARTLRVLSIGNSFSQDAVEQYLHELALADGDTMIIGNMYIGGCSLKRHVTNAREDKPAYKYRKIGTDGKRVETLDVALSTALKDEPWDYVSFQQSSPLSGQYDTWERWLPELRNYVKSFVGKKTKFMIHQTWAYAKTSTHKGFANYGGDQDSMYHSIVSAVHKIANKLKIKLIMPAGTAIQNARTSFIGDNLNRDGYHLDRGVGRFTAACAWYATLTGRDVTLNSYMPDGITSDYITVAKAAGQAAAKSPERVTDLSHLTPGEK